MVWLRRLRLVWRECTHTFHTCLPARAVTPMYEEVRGTQRGTSQRGGAAVESMQGPSTGTLRAKDSSAVGPLFQTLRAQPAWNWGRGRSLERGCRHPEPSHHSSCEDCSWLYKWTAKQEISLSTKMWKGRTCVKACNEACSAVQKAPVRTLTPSFCTTCSMFSR